MWASDRDGTLGTGTQLTKADLSLGRHVITLTATDHLGAVGTASVTIDIVPNDPPTATITSPADGQAFTMGESITFAGAGTDPQDGALSGASLAWSSDRDGALGTGESLVRDDLSTGTHVVSLAATDRHGATGSASITIEIEAPVVPNQPPVITITEPAIGTYLAGFAVPFAGTATDPEDGPLSGGSLVWTSSWEGVIGTGTSFTRSDLRVGSHVITLTAADSDGATASATRSVTIQGAGTATIRGRVQVPGLGISGVTVTATGPVTRSTVTNGNGNYKLSALTAGTYALTISNIPPASCSRRPPAS